MAYSITTALKRISKQKGKIRAQAGGTSAGKTISDIMLLIGKAQTDKTPKLTSIISESIPHLKRGVMRDFMNIMQAHNYWDKNRWNATDRIYTFETGSKIEFFSADDWTKLKGGRRDRLYINEANNIEYKSFEQAFIRTKEFTILDWNPDREFWFYTKVKDMKDKNGKPIVDFITLTYLDNEALDKNIVDSIEAKKDDVEWWKVYGLGQLGEVSNRVFKGWRIIPDVPFEAELISRGLDFGYTNDPSSLIEIYKYNGGYIAKEIFYRHGMSNKRIADEIISIGNDEVMTFADSAEPKSIDEIKSYGVNIVGVEKGKGSILHSIQWIKSVPMSVTSSSTNLIKEYRGYLWKRDKRTDEVLNVPSGVDHALDALRYSLSLDIHKKRIYDEYDYGIMEAYEEEEDNYI